MDKDRLMHSYAVAKKMVEIGKKFNLSDDSLHELFVLGFNHDIGYEYAISGVDHNKIGGNILRKSGYKFWKEVYYHGEINVSYSSLYLDILNSADMSIDKYGHDVGHIKRLDDIKSRYKIDSKVYITCKSLVDELVKKGL